MISSMQPSRPRLPQQTPPPPTNQQPTRSSTSSTSPLRPHPPTAPSAPVYQSLPPRNQIEAMPPFPPPRTPRSTIQVPAPQQMLDASRRHPVFFTDRLKKAPNGVSAGGGSWISPVAVGYVFNDGARREGDVKL